MITLIYACICAMIETLEIPTEFILCTWRDCGVNVDLDLSLKIQHDRNCIASSSL